MKHRFFLPVAVILAGCQSPDAAVSTSVPTVALAIEATSPHHAPVSPKPGSQIPGDQLAQARAATARYHDVRSAIADGYKNTGIIIANMGTHFLKDSLLDGRFDAGHPELLVYSPDQNGGLRLVAVEYAVPLALSATAPEGFRGDADEWFADQNFLLWTLHSWVWKENPDGVFNPTNKQVP